jgi:sensor histidine kinase regulating citrate/malate metabolism
MKEGLILIDKKRAILSANKSALTFLNAKDKDYTSLSLLTLCRILCLFHT